MGWEKDGIIGFGDLLCLNNIANGYGGCLSAEGSITLANRTVMRGNTAENGGCVLESSFCLTPHAHL